MFDTYNPGIERPILEINVYNANTIMTIVMKSSAGGAPLKIIALFNDKLAIFFVKLTCK